MREEDWTRALEMAKIYEGAASGESLPSPAETAFMLRRMVDWCQEMDGCVKRNSENWQHVVGQLNIEMSRLHGRNLDAHREIASLRAKWPTT